MTSATGKIGQSEGIRAADSIVTRGAGGPLEEPLEQRLEGGHEVSCDVRGLCRRRGKSRLEAPRQARGWCAGGTPGRSEWLGRRKRLRDNGLNPSLSGWMN